MSIVGGHLVLHCRLPYQELSHENKVAGEQGRGKLPHRWQSDRTLVASNLCWDLAQWLEFVLIGLTKPILGLGRQGPGSGHLDGRTPSNC